MSERWLWTQKEDIGPSPRYGHAMAYEAARQRVVLFGGSGGTSPLFNDTWGWDGVAWTQLADMGPPARLPKRRGPLNATRPQLRRPQAQAGGSALDC